MEHEGDGVGGAGADSGANDIAVFGGSNVVTSQVATLDAGQSVLDLLFQNTGYAVSIGAGTPTTSTLAPGTSGITMDNGAGANTISSDVMLNGPQTWTNNSSSLLTIGGGVTTGGNLLTIVGSGSTIMSRTIGRNGKPTAGGTGTLSLSGANNCCGGTTVSGGALVINSSSALGTGALTITGGAATAPWRALFWPTMR